MPCMEKLFPHLDNDNNDDDDGDDEDGVCNFDDSEEDGHDCNNHCLKKLYLDLDNDNEDDGGGIPDICHFFYTGKIFGE